MCRSTPEPRPINSEYRGNNRFFRVTCSNSTSSGRPDVGEPPGAGNLRVNSVVIKTIGSERF